MKEIHGKNVLDLQGFDSWLIRMIALGLLSLFYLFGNTAYGQVRQSAANQEISLAGKVMDEKGDPVIGASIVLKGSPSTGTVTDMDGLFTITVPDNSMLVVSYIGYKTTEIAVNGRTEVEVVLSEDMAVLEELVVVGYGVQKKVSVTGSVSAIQSDRLIEVKSPNVSNMLAGRLPGLRAVQRSGSPGDDNASVDIRGYGNMLVIVDGIERDYTQLNPNDIESISILKDAAAAVYGFKGSNGVLLVTTKKGEVSKPKISYDGYYGVQQITRYPDLLTPYEYASLYNESIYNLNPTGGVPAYSEEQLEAFRNGGGANWFNEAVRKSSPQTSHNLSVSGGTEKVRYFLSAGYMDQDGFLKTGDWNYKRFTVRSNISVEVAKGFTVDMQMAGRSDTRTKPYDSDALLNNIQMTLPIYTVYANNNPQYWQGPLNPVQMTHTDLVGYDDRMRMEFNGSLGFTWQLPWVEGLTAKALIAYDYNNTENKKWSKELYRYTWDASTETYNKSTVRSLSNLEVRNQNYQKPTQQYSLNYNRLFLQKHDIGAMLLWEMYEDKKTWVQGNKEFNIGLIPDLDFGDSNNQKTSGKTEETAHQGLVGRLNYAFDGRYLVEFNFRYDGSYKFSPDSRWGFFPGVSAGWRISEEPFFKRLLPDVDNLKLRGSYAKVGDEGDFSAFQYLSGYSYSGNYILGSGGVTTGLQNRGMANTWLTWYESEIKNIGFEASYKKGLLSMEFDYFQRNRSGLPATRTGSLPTTFGQSMPQENLNSDKNRGFEISIGHRHKIGEFTYDLAANFSTTRIINDYVEREAATNMYDNWRNNTNGRYKDIRWGKRVTGQFTSYEDILNSPIQDGNGNKTLMPGDLKFEDWNNDGVVDDNDIQPIGHGSSPRMYYGLNVAGEYKGIDLTLFFQGAAGHDVYINDDMLDPFIQQGLGNGLEIMNDRWHRVDPADPYSEWIPGFMPAIRTAGYSYNRGENTWSLHKSDYLRLKSVELGYTLPETLFSGYGITKARFYVNCNNLLTFTSNNPFMKTMDPENENRYLRYYPQTKTFNFGINVTF